MLAPELRQALDRIGPTEIVIGLPTYNNARTIRAVLEAIRLGLAKHFPDVRAVLIGCDGGSTDETPALLAGAEWEAERVLTQHAVPPAERAEVPYHGIPGRAAAQRTLLAAAHVVGARACAFFGADSLGIAPDWVDRLLRPVFEESYDYVAPLYRRHRYDGTLTYGLLYPLTRALYGKRTRNPLGGQNGLSGRLVAHLVGQDAAGAAAGAEFTRRGLDLWMTATAAGGFRVCEAWLGSGAVDAVGRTSDLATTLAQVTGSIFALLEHTAEVWAEVRGSEAVPTTGAPLPLGAEPR